MPTVRELSELYDNFMLGPRPGVGVCRECFNLTDGYERCYACTRHPSVLDAMVPISYSIAHEQLHHALASYKRLNGEVARRLGLQLGAVLWRFLGLHERCVARAVGQADFELVATVPSVDRLRDELHPLRWIVSEARWPHPRSASALDTPFRPRGGPADLQPAEVCRRGDFARRVGAPDRRHVDDGQQRAKCRGGPQGRGRRSGRHGRDRSTRESELAAKRPEAPTVGDALRLAPLRPMRTSTGDRG